MIMFEFFQVTFGHKFRFKYVREKADTLAADIFGVSRRYVRGCLHASSSSLASQSL